MSIGSPKIVAKKIYAAAESGLFNTFMGEFNFPDLPESDLMRSIRRFGEKVMSALRGTNRSDANNSPVPRRPKEHLMSTMVQNPQSIGLLRHVQGAEERFGFHLCAVQIRLDERNPKMPS